MSKSSPRYVQARHFPNYASCCPTCGKPLLDKPTLEMILNDVARRHRVTQAAILGKGKGKIVCAARDEVVYHARQLNYTLEGIGYFLGNRKHSTIHHAVRRHQARLTHATSSQNISTAS